MRKTSRRRFNTSFTLRRGKNDIDSMVPKAHNRRDKRRYAPGRICRGNGQACVEQGAHPKGGAAIRSTNPGDVVGLRTQDMWENQDNEQAFGPGQWQKKEEDARGCNEEDLGDRSRDLRQVEKALEGHVIAWTT
jgi:hypothetical protein